MTQIFKRKLKNIDSKFNKYFNKNPITNNKLLTENVNINKKIIKNDDIELINYLENNTINFNNIDILKLYNYDNSITMLDNLLTNITINNFYNKKLLLDMWFRENNKNLENKTFVNNLIDMIVLIKIRGMEEINKKYNKKNIINDVTKSIKYIISNKDAFNLNIINILFKIDINISKIK